MLWLLFYFYVADIFVNIFSLKNADYILITKTI
jgi:hypothetical protein